MKNLLVDLTNRPTAGGDRISKFKDEGHNTSKQQKRMEKSL